MTWYYADWSWVQTFITTAALAVSCVVVACAIVNLIRSHLTARHAPAIVPTRFDLEPGTLPDTHHHNGSRAA